MADAASGWRSRGRMGAGDGWRPPRAGHHAMNFLGVATVPINGPCDAGAGRVAWLASKIAPHESVVDLGGTGSMLVPWHPAEQVTALDDLSGFGKGHRLYAGTFHRGDVCDLSR